MTRLLKLLALMTACWLSGALEAQTAPPIVLVNATVVDGTGSPARRGQTVVVEAGLIRSIGLSGEHELPPGARTFDLAGKTMIPGLIDGHIHLTQNRERVQEGLAKMLRAGITSVRDLAGDARIARSMEARGAAHPGTLPDVIYSASLWGPQFLRDPRSQASQPGLEPGSAPWARTVDERSDPEAVAAQARAFGVTGLKLYASLSSERLVELAAAGRAQGLHIWSHSMVFPTTVHHVIAAEPTQIIHAKGFISAGRTDLPDNFTDGIRKWVPRQDFANTDPASEIFQQLFARMVGSEIILEPALLADGDLRPQPLPPWRAAMRQWACRLTAAARDAGVVISAGTDTAGDDAYLPLELSRLVECGLTPLEALQAATLHNARALGLAQELGSVEVGKRANLVVLRRDPTVDIAHVREVAMVLKDGRVVLDALNPEP